MGSTSRCREAGTKELGRGTENRCNGVLGTTVSQVEWDEYRRGMQGDEGTRSKVGISSTKRHP